MAKVIGPLFSLDAHGTLARTLTYLRTRTGHAARRTGRPPAHTHPFTLAIRRGMKGAAALWATLTGPEKLAWQADARRRGIHPFAAFCAAGWGALHAHRSYRKHPLPEPTAPQPDPVLAISGDTDETQLYLSPSPAEDTWHTLVQASDSPTPPPLPAELAAVIPATKTQVRIPHRGVVPKFLHAQAVSDKGQLSASRSTSRVRVTRFVPHFYYYRCGDCDVTGWPSIARFVRIWITDRTYDWPHPHEMWYEDCELVYSEDKPWYFGSHLDIHTSAQYMDETRQWSVCVQPDLHTYIVPSRHPCRYAATQMREYPDPPAPPRTLWQCTIRPTAWLIPP